MEREAGRSSSAGERLKRGDGHTDDSTYGSAKEATKDSSSRDLPLLLRRVSDRTARVHNGRQGLRVKRQRFRQLVQQTAELMTSFLSAVQYSSTQMQMGDERSVFQVLQDLRQVNDKIREEMHSYDNYEHAVSIDEYALSLEENQLHQDFSAHRGSTQVLESIPFARSITPQRPAKPEVSASPIPTPIQAYDAKIGEANMLREGLKELALEQDEYLGKQSRGSDLDSDELRFLETYDETYEQSHDELLATEQEIRKLEGPAREMGLSPSAIYQPYLSPPSPLELPPSGLSLDQRDTDSVSQIYLDLQGLGDAHAGNPAVQSLGQPASGGFSASYINRWLSGLPLELVKTTSAFATREGSRLIQYLREQLLEPHEKATSTKSDPKESMAPDFVWSDQLRADWVKVDKTESPKLKPLTRRKNISSSSRTPKAGTPDNPENLTDASQKFPELDLARTAAIPSIRPRPGRTEHSNLERA
jgi:hypothetical protein